MGEDAKKPDDQQGRDQGLSPVEKATIASANATVASAKAARYSAIIAVLAILVAGGTAAYSNYLTQRQDADTQQQELVALIGDITQEQQASSTAAKGNSVSSELLVLGDAEEADNIINSLNSGVSQVEKYLVALGLQDGGDYQTASTLFTEAAKETSFPRITADAWRGAAAALYAVGSSQKAESDIKNAEDASGAPSNLPYTELFDIPYRAAISDCLTADAEWRNVAQLTEAQRSLLTGNNAVTAEINARAALTARCKMAAGALENVYIAGSISPQT